MYHVPSLQRFRPGVVAKMFRRVTATTLTVMFFYYLLTYQVMFLPILWLTWFDALIFVLFALSLPLATHWVLVRLHFRWRVLAYLASMSAGAAYATLVLALLTLRDRPFLPCIGTGTLIDGLCWVLGGAAGMASVGGFYTREHSPSPIFERSIVVLAIVCSVVGAIARHVTHACS